MTKIARNLAAAAVVVTLVSAAYAETNERVTYAADPAPMDPHEQLSGDAIPAPVPPAQRGVRTG